MNLREATDAAISSFGSSIIYEPRILSIIDNFGGVVTAYRSAHSFCCI